MMDLPVLQSLLPLEGCSHHVLCSLCAQHFGSAGGQAFPGPAFQLLEMPGATFYQPVPAALPANNEGLQRVGDFGLSSLELVASWKVGAYIEDGSFKPSIW